MVDQKETCFRVQRDTSTGDFNIVAKFALEPNQKVMELEGDLLDVRDMHSIETSVDKHLLISNGLKYTDHSCDPNCEIIFTEPIWYLKTSRRVEKDEKLTYDYTTTEFVMSVPFDCVCGAANCCGRISGFKNLKEEEKSKRIDKISPVVKHYINQFNKK